MVVKTRTVFVLIDKLRAKPLLELFPDDIYINCKTHLVNALNIMSPNAPVKNS